MGKEEKKTAESSTTVSSLSESEKGLNVDQLLKKEKAKKKKKQSKTITSMSTSATSVASTSSKSKPRKSASLSKTTEVEAEPVLISEEEKAEGTVPEGQEEEFPETVAVPGRKRKGKPVLCKPADMKGKVLNLWMDLQQCAREFLNPGTPKIVGRWNDVYGPLTKINFQET